MSLLLGTSVCLFWQEEYKFYSSTHKNSQKRAGSHVDLGLQVLNHRPSFLHFYDNSCKFSRTNLAHLGLFIGSDTTLLDYYVVCKARTDTAMLRAKYAVPRHMKFLYDSTGQIARKCGVGSTPQAAIIDADQSLYFVGDYSLDNSLCGPANIQYSGPAIALDRILRNKPFMINPTISFSAGCNI